MSKIKYAEYYQLFKKHFKDVKKISKVKEILNI